MLALIDGRDLAPHHVLDQAVGRDVRQVAGVHGGAVAQHGDAVADGAQFVHAVRYINDAHAAGFEIAHDAEDLLRFGIGQRRGGLVEDQQARAVLNGAADLDQLAAGGAEAVDARFGIERKTVLLDEAARFVDDRAAIHPAEGAAIFAPEKNVLRDGHVRREQRLLVHHRDADGGGFGGRAQETSLPFHSMRPASRSTMPATIFMSVDLPAPFSPSSRWTSPAATESSPLREAR
jgi:hypothetical protein